MLNIKKTTIIPAIIAILILIFGYIIIFTDTFKKEIFSKESRVENIKKERKSDDELTYKTIGWLKVQGTNIDTPIITYTTKEVNMVASKENYLWNVIKDEKLHNKVNIMGHNLLNLSSTPDIGLSDFSRFDDLMSFIYYDFVKDNKYIQYTIGGHDYIYKIYAVNFEEQYNLNIYTEGDVTGKFLYKFAQKEIKNSLYDFNVKVNKNDKIISLVTCTRFFGTDDDREFVVNARLVHKNEKLTNYKVTKTKRYKKVEEILRGDLKNEKM